MSSFIFKSTGFIISWLERIFKTKLTIEGLENLPNNPTIFVANHFTRAETFIMPYALYKRHKQKVRSLADNTVFVGKLGAYLRKMGTLSTDNPDRNNIILGDLITGRSNWLIYPEGLMVKNKKILHKNYEKDYYMEKNGKLLPVRTGSTVLAIHAEFVRRKLRNAEEKGDKKTIKQIKKEFFIEDGEISTPLPPVIIPVNISYYPIRPGGNKIKNIFAKMFAKMPLRVHEELEIEGNIIMHSDINIHFGKPIKIADYIDNTTKIINKVPFIKTQTIENLVVKRNRYKLTNIYLNEIYKNILVNIDHLISCILYYYPEDSLSKDKLKKQIYLARLFILKNSEIRFHPNLKKIYNFFTDENSRVQEFTNFIKLMKEQGLIRETNNGTTIEINRAKLHATYNFHEIRMKNNAQIMVNEASYLQHFISHLAYIASLKNKKVEEEIFNLLLNEDLRNFTEDYEKHFNKTFSKPQSIGRPFFLGEAKKQNKIGVVLCHGYKSAPEEVRELAEFLQSQGIAVYALRLKGHGTSPDDMKETQWQDWYESYNRAYVAMKHKCDKIFLAGFSTGGLLSLVAAAKKSGSKNIAGVISISAALKLNDIRTRLVPSVHLWNEMLSIFKTKKATLEYIDDEPENPEINYSRNYLRSVVQLGKLMKHTEDLLPKINFPTLIIQGKKDPVVNPKSAKIIYQKILSKQKKLVEINADNHVIIRGQHKKEVFNVISEFINNTSSIK